MKNSNGRQVVMAQEVRQMAPSYLVGESIAYNKIKINIIQSSPMYSFWGLIYIKQWTRMRDEFYNRLYDFVDTRKGFRGPTARQSLGL